MLVVQPKASYTTPHNPGIVFVVDHQPHVSGMEGCNTIVQTVQDHQYDVEHVYMDHYLHWQDFPYPYTCVPHCFLKYCRYFLEHAQQGVCTDDQRCFVMMNKRREHRLLVSAWFSHNRTIDFDYSQGWTPEHSDTLAVQEYTRLTSYQLDSFLEERFLPYQDTVSSNQDQSGYLAAQEVDIWNTVLRPKFCTSTFSVVTEPPYWENGCMITEKYLMTLYGCCFPIFCGGGLALADQLKQIGFDVFDDIVDHSYQYVADPAQRVLDALECNRELLLGNSVRKADYMDRHHSNLRLVREHLDRFKQQFADSQFDKYRSSL